MYHDCSSYCMKCKLDEQGNEYETCRFYFPKECRDDYMLVVEKGRTVVSMAVPRDHPRIGAFVRVSVQGWKANCDFQLVVDHKALAEYICKYATKPEKETTTFSQLIGKIQAAKSNNADNDLGEGLPDACKTYCCLPTGKVMTMLLNTGWAERDIGEVEVSHLLLGLPLVMTSRQFETTSLGGNYTLAETDADTVEEREQNKQKKAFNAPAKVKWYTKRPQYLENCSLHDMMSQCKTGKYETLPQSEWKVPHIIPWYGRRVLSAPAWKEESYARQRLLLHKPFRSPEDVVAGFEHHGDNQHVAALEAWLASPRCPAVLRWEKSCADLDQERGADFSDDEEDDNPEDPDKEYEEWMDLMSRAHVTEDGLSTFDKPTNDWDWQAVRSRFTNHSVSLEGLKQWLDHTKQQEGDTVPFPSSPLAPVNFWPPTCCRTYLHLPPSTSVSPLVDVGPQLTFPSPLALVNLGPPTC